ncbi:major facilitator superfamily domain-containing protein [Zychaea mexicana]|uniref:major facilitator superfamily domain-containing protein n=1 Tax=Zychaea mexicana TaxID=64656 RepID=UPI0022FDCF17|nr:major facilitator superfamily domain-containing protein [Zychaea mexicana]KAI9497313.1 major facilitator superfamily domain-containing protein [Zychaea mexicana]
MCTLDTKAVDTRPKASLLQLCLTTMCFAGIQFTWTVELSYGTPYLLSLELSKELTALVWFAAPLSGLIVQPLVGAWSDKHTSRLGRRRPFILGGGVFVCLSLLCVAYSKQIAAIFVTDDNPAQSKVAIAVAVSAFYVLDFSLNAVQASCRSLILDVFPITQQDTANAFASNTQNVTNVFGYFIGFVDLVKYVPGLGKSQMEAFCTAGVIVFVCAISVTCFAVKEVPYRKTRDESSEPWYLIFVYIWHAFRQLPSSVQKLCNVMFFAWMGWFPFLFYSTTWISDIYFQTHEMEDPDAWDKGTRAGSFALLLYAIVAVIAGTVLPILTANGYVSLKNTYTLSHVVFAIAMVSTVFVHTVAGATFLLSLLGISFACAMWIPYALVGEYLVVENKQQQDVEEQVMIVEDGCRIDGEDGVEQSGNSTARPRTASSNSSSSSKDVNYGATTTAVGSSSVSSSSSQQGPAAVQTQKEDHNKKTKYDAGMVLGVLNMYVVFPQFAVAIISAVIFAIVHHLQSKNKDAEGGGGSPEEGSMEEAAGVAWVLRFGGLMAVIAAVLSRRVIDVQARM